MITESPSANQKYRYKIIKPNTSLLSFDATSSPERTRVSEFLKVKHLEFTNIKYGLLYVGKGKWRIERRIG